MSRSMKSMSFYKPSSAHGQNSLMTKGCACAISVAAAVIVWCLHVLCVLVVAIMGVVGLVIVVINAARSEKQGLKYVVRLLDVGHGGLKSQSPRVPASPVGSRVKSQLSCVGDWLTSSGMERRAPQARCAERCKWRPTQRVRAM